MASRSRKARFLLEHTICCYCGRPSATIDHRPSRQLFFERHPPDRMIFPACEPCNSATRLDETVLAYWARMNYSHPDQAIEERFDDETRRILQGLRNNRPECVPELLSTNEKKRRLRQIGLTVPAGETIAEQPLVSIPPPAVAAIKRSLTRLTCALVYLHLGKVAPPRAAYWAHVATNVTIWAQDPFSQFPFTFDHPEIPSSHQLKLSDLFRYRWSLASDGSVFAVAMQFGQSFVGIGACVLNPTQIDEDRRIWTTVNCDPWLA